MSGVNRSQIELAKTIKILDYIYRNEPDNVRRVGNAHYLKDHDSLEISNGLWNWHSMGIGGRNVIDYLMKVRGYDFVSAVRHLTGNSAVARHVEPKSRPPPDKTSPDMTPPDMIKSPPDLIIPRDSKDTFSLPPRNRDNERVIAYLQRRGIDRQLIMDCIERGALYESAKWHNCVFVGRDDNGKARFAAMRGTNGNLKRDAARSDKRFGFFLPPLIAGSTVAAIFESPIDALSHQTLYPDFPGWRLSLGCTALSALTNFLGRHKEVNSCIVCTDNDDAGNMAAKRIEALTTCITVTRAIPPVGKDWNETLIQARKDEKPLEDKRKTIRFIDGRHNTLFTVKDGDSIKFTNGFDGEEKKLKCRWIDDVHIQLIDKYRNDYHIGEFAEITERNGSKCEPIPAQKPELNVLVAKYGEALQDVAIPMSESAIRKLVGGKYDVEELYSANKSMVLGILLRGRDGIAVCGTEDNVPTSLHPYWSQKYKRELSPAEKPHRQPSLLGALDKAKDEAKSRNAAVSAAMPKQAEQAL